ncbi:hypothetical protein K3495_g9633 [Podosphaera aphanis]|nr:hypothetical protein K3495_g9633 [Podosphaera aphanis]
MVKFLGTTINRKSDGIRINKQNKIEALCDDLGLLHCKGSTVPIADDNLVDSESHNLCTSSEVEKYRSAVGSLLHIAGMTRPDIQYAVDRLSRYVRSPSQNSMLALKHLLRYLSRTKSAALFFPRKGDGKLKASSDSSWGNINTSKGTTRNFFLTNGTPIAWWSKKQTITAQSSCEAEYTALSALAVTAKWIQQLYNEIFCVEKEAILTEIDNTSALITANSN